LLLDSNRITALALEIIFAAAFALAIGHCAAIFGDLKEAVPALLTDALPTAQA
jgi:hypothetical protein